MTAFVNTRPILALAGDPGGATALAPVVALLKKDAARPVLACAYRQAFDLWRDRSLDPLPPGTWEDRLPKLVAGAVLVLTATSVNGEDRERAAIALARQHGVPCLAVLDFWSNYAMRFSDRQGALVLPDRIAIMDEMARQEMLVAGFPSASLVVTGQPAFDALLGAHTAFTPQRRSELRRELGVEEDELLALFVSQPFAAIYGSREAAREAIGFAEDEVLALCRRTLADFACRHGLRFVFAVRPHPRDADDIFPEMRETGLRSLLWKTPDRLDAAMSADIVIGMNSVLLYEAARLGCPVVSVQPGLLGNDALPSNRTGLSLVVYDKDKLGNALTKALFDDDWRTQRRIEVDKEPLIPSATLRIVQEIAKLLESASRSTHKN